MFTSELGNDPVGRCLIVMTGFPSFLLLKLSFPPVFSHFINEGSAGLKIMQRVSVDNICQMEAKEQNRAVKFLI